MGVVGEYAHSLEGEPEERWEPLVDHLKAVGRRAGHFAQRFGAGDLGEAAGLLHDLGKRKPAFQKYLRGQSGGVPHSGEGARFACKRWDSGFGKILAFCIAGHHAGLANGRGHNAAARPSTSLSQRLADEMLAEISLPEDISLPERFPVPSFLAGIGRGDDRRHFRLQFFTRMLFSALVDADFLETEAFYDRALGRRTPRGWQGRLADLRAALDLYLKELTAEAPDTPVNNHRAEILQHARRRAKEPPGLFTLTVPTGGGKTLTSLAFALDHAIAHGLERIIYVIPFVSIIEQTAAVFRRALGDADAVLEHHASFDWAGADDDKERERYRLACENWDRPVVVTTSVQFFESLFSNRPARCRKLHRLARAVIILDEAQMLPLALLRPCLAALQELVRGYGATVVFCSATQPALKRGPDGDGFPAPEGLEPARLRELAPDPPRLYAAFRRVRVADAGLCDDESLAEAISRSHQILVIVNNRRHARALYDRVADCPGRFLLTTYLTACHREAVLAEVRRRLAAGEPVRLIATSLIEAGVDVDFPCVWREAAGIDSIAQAAGRCNREGRLPEGEVFVFRTTGEFRPPPVLEQFAQIGARILERHADPLSLDAVRDYFREVYWTRGEEALDAREVHGSKGILKAIARSGDTLDFPFADVAQAFRIIDDAELPLVITHGPWGVPAELWDRLQFMPHIATIARSLQRYQVSLPGRLRATLIACGAASWWRSADFGEQIGILDNPRLYDEQAGFCETEPEELGALIV